MDDYDIGYLQHSVMFKYYCYFQTNSFKLTFQLLINFTANKKQTQRKHPSKNKHPL